MQRHSTSHPYFEISSPGSKKDVVGVPVQGGNCGADGLLDVFGHPPVVFLLKVAHRDEPCTRPHSKLVLCGGNGS